MACFLLLPFLACGLFPIVYPANVVVSDQIPRNGMTLLRERLRQEWTVIHDIPLNWLGLVQKVVRMRREEGSSTFIKKEELREGCQGLSDED